MGSAITPTAASRPTSSATVVLVARAATVDDGPSVALRRVRTSAASLEGS